MWFIRTLLICIPLFYSGCKKASSETITQHSSVIGKWKLDEYRIDPGNGSGVLQKANPDHPVYLEFKADGRLYANDAIATYDRYQVLNDSTMNLTYTAANHTIAMKYKFQPDKLILYPSCIEGCEYRYKAISRN